MSRRLNLSVRDIELLEHLAASRRLAGMFPGKSAFLLLRETYFDTPDGLLRERGMKLCLRVEARGRQVVELTVQDVVNLQGVVEETVLEIPAVGGGLYSTVSGQSEVATRLRGVADMAALRPQLALDIDREERDLKSSWWGRPQHRVSFDHVVAHAPGVTRAFYAITLTELAAGRMSLEAVGEKLRTDHRVESDGHDGVERMHVALTGSADSRVEIAHEVRVAPLILQDGKVALMESRDGLRLPDTRGAGEELAREFLGELLSLDGGGVELDLIGFAPMQIGGADLEVWLHVRPPMTEGLSGFAWVPLDELMERVGGPRLRDPGLVAALLLLVRSEIGRRLLRDSQARAEQPTRVPVQRDPSAEPGSGGEDFLDLELSILDFNQRVLELAEDERIPLLERFFFLSIFSSNLDEFFVVRVARLKEEAELGPSGEGEALSPRLLLDLVAIRVRALMARQYACLTQMLLPQLAEQGIRLRRWEELRPEERDGLSAKFLADIFPLLTPLSMSAGPGRSFPRLPSLGLSLATVLRQDGESKTDFGYVPVPDSLPRFIHIPGTEDLIGTGDLIMANAARLFPSFEVVGVHAFRVSRMDDVEIDEDSSGSLLARIADEVEDRRFKPVVRIEVQGSMPREVRAHLLRELRVERGSDSALLTGADVYEVDGPIDVEGFGELTDLELPGGRFAPYEATHPIPDDVSIFDVLSQRDLLVHHPFESFHNTVGRFLSEAADDPDVMSIKLTLYRTGRDSALMEALLRAVEAGKDVSVFVELKARFDEESNIEWTHRLTEAGAHVVYGVVGYKTHAKTALVVRKEADGVRRYVHIGTGNYNADTARYYTDVGLMSSDPDLGADMSDFFNELTGGIGPPQKEFRRLLVAPNSLAQRLDRMIQREIDHARAGRPARIQAKLNSLADRTIVKSLYRAAAEGVRIDLIVRSICTLRPGVPGLSEGIHVRSVLGRFLEHSRIVYFENAGQGEFYIGSADWRARNLRRRVEVVTPVDSPAARKVLRTILDTQLADPRAWVLRPDGVFERLQGEGSTSQHHFMALAQNGRAVR